MVPQVYYDVGFGENANYYAFLWKVINVVQSEVLCLKQSEHSYYAFRCIDLSTVTENQWYLQSDVSASVHIENQKRSKKLWSERPKFITVSFDKFIINFKVRLL